MYPKTFAEKNPLTMKNSGMRSGSRMRLTCAAIVSIPSGTARLTCRSTTPRMDRPLATSGQRMRAAGAGDAVG
ncbi:hypothetical protein GCM10010980_13320 [Corynebacterium marinum]|nr:hypothetical protein GCM10010980_13320 [Corynebacterium marinum]